MLTAKTLKYIDAIPQFKGLTEEQQSLVDSYFQSIDLAKVASGNLEDAQSKLSELIGILKDYPPIDQQVMGDIYENVKDALFNIGQWINREIGSKPEGLADYWHNSDDKENWEALHGMLTAKTAWLIGSATER